MYVTFVTVTTQLLGALQRIRAAELGVPPPPRHADNVRQIQIDGDLIFGGLFPVHAKGTDIEPCGDIMEGNLGLNFITAVFAAAEKAAT